MKRAICIVLDSVGVGELPDAAEYGDAGSNTLRSAASSARFVTPNMETIGLGQIEGVADWWNPNGIGLRFSHSALAADQSRNGATGRAAEASKGKDTTIGHWEIAGLISPKPMPTFPNGFPQALLDKLSEQTGRGILCNQPYSGTEVIKEYGEEHVKTGKLIVYTSADSVLQIAAHEDVVPVPELYRYCEIARALCQGEYGVGRIIARPFIGEYPFTRTANRHDFSLLPPRPTMLNVISENGQEVLGVGKIFDIFAGSGVTDTVRTKSNDEGIERTLERLDREFQGLLFVNLVDFDMVFGHRNNIEGYANALTEFDRRLPEIAAKLRDEDLLIITADHGCDPGTLSTDHSREYIPILAYGKQVKAGRRIGTRGTYADIAATILEYLDLSAQKEAAGVAGTSFLQDIIQTGGYGR